MRCPVCHAIVYDHRGRGNHPDQEFQGPEILICLNGHHMDRKKFVCNEAAIPKPRKPVRKKCEICKKTILDLSPGHHRRFCPRCKYQRFLGYAAAYRERKRGKKRGR